MEIWLRVIVEWINCLDILGAPAKDLKALEDGEFYKKLIRMSWKGSSEIAEKDDIVQEFLKDAYPDYKCTSDGWDDKEQVCLASLFLLYTSQEPVFQQPMCYKLEHDTQIKIKTFLEMILPHGKCITRDIVRDAVSELSGCAVHTPITPKARSLKEFFDSPVARSAQRDRTAMEKNREIRKLRNELEVERFEKLDLQEDLRIQQLKIQNLHKKLAEKTAEMKALKEEQMRPITPQSCKKDTDWFREQYFRKEIDRLENQVMEKQRETESLEADNASLSKRVAYGEKQCSVLREQCQTYERSLESLQVQAELKDRELVNLKATNQELRTYLRELSKSSFDEHSFEGDETSTPLSPSNSSEALSTVVEIQLQEAKEESALLKCQLDALNKRLENTTQQLHERNGELQEREARLLEVQAELSAALDKLDLASERAETLGEEKAELERRIENLERTHASLNSELELRIENLECAKASLNSELERRGEESDREISRLMEDRENQKKRIEELSRTVEEYAEQIKEGQAECTHLNDLVKVNLSSIELLESSVEEYKRRVEVLEKVELEKNKLEEKVFILEEEASRLQKEATRIDQLLKSSRLQNADLEKSLADLKTLKDSEMKEIERRLTEDSQVRLDTTEKEWRAKYESLQGSFKAEQKLRSDLGKKLENLEDRLKSSETLNSDLVKGTTTAQGRINALQEEILAEKRKSEELIIEENRLKEKARTMERDLESLQQENKTLQTTLMEERSSITDLRQELERERVRSGDLEEQTRNLKTENIALEKSRSESLARLESLQDVIDLREEEARKLSTRLDLKDQELSNLTEENTRVRTDYQRMVDLQKESESRVQALMEELQEKERDLNNLGSQLNLKEASLNLIQAKYQHYAKEASATEMRLKEVIANLQEVRATQEAVMSTQELALKEKTVYSEDLLGQFEELKSKYSKELQNERSLSRNLQCKWSDLQIQSYKQTRTIEELEETLKRERSTLKETRENLRTEVAKRTKVVNVCEQLQLSVNGLRAIKAAIPEVNGPRTTSMDVKHDEDQVLRIVGSAIEEVQATGSLVQDLFEEKLRLEKMEDLVRRSHQEAELLKKRILDLEETKGMISKGLFDLIERKCSLRDSIRKLMNSRTNLDKSLETLETRWSEVLEVNKDVLQATETSGCEEAIKLRARKAKMEDSLRGQKISYLRGERQLRGILWREFLLTKNNLEETRKSLEPKNSLEGTKNNLEGTKNNLEGARNNLEGTKNNLEGTKNNLEGTNKNLEESKNNLEGTKNNLEGTKNNLEESKNNLEGTKNNLEGTKNNLEGTKNNLEESRNNLEGTRNNLEGTKNNLEGTRNNLEGTRNNLEGTRNNLEGTKNNLEGIRNNLESTNKNLEDSKNNLEGTWNNLEGTNKNLEDSKNNLEGTRNNLEGTKNNLEGTKKNLQETSLELEPKKNSNQEDVLDPELSCTQVESIEYQLERNRVLQDQVNLLEKEIQDFSEFVNSFSRTLQTDERILWSESERKLRADFHEMAEERNQVSSKLASTRLRNSDLEDQLNQLKMELDALKKSSDDLRTDKRSLDEDNSRLREERDRLRERPTQEDVDARLQEAHARYKGQLEETKQKMTAMCNEQIARLSKEQERCMKEMESLQGRMKEQCIKQAEEINSYKSHVSNLTSQFWNVAEKLLTEQQRTVELRKELDQTKATLQNTKLQIGQQQTMSISTMGHQRSIKTEKVESKEDVFQKISLIKEKTTYERRYSIMQMVGGNAFNAEDEEGEVFDNNYLADMKKGPSPGAANADRLFELKMRNSLCKPHLKTSYPAELQFNPLPFTEEEIKAGTMQEDVFNDSLSQSLLPDQKPKKRDRTQTSYKKPGPPTPSKNGGRLSLQGNELRSPGSRILRDRNKDRATATPTAFAKLFRRCDENNVVTPKDRRKSLGLRRNRATTNR